MADDQDTGYPDKVVVEGIDRRVDGEYGCDVVKMLVQGNPETLTNGEGHKIKMLSGVRAGELMDALAAGDNDVLTGLCVVVVARHGRRLDEDLLWDAPMGAVRLVIADRDKDGDGDVPPVAPQPSEQIETPTPSGGGSGSTPAGPPQENDPSGTGQPPSDTSATSAPAT